MNARRPLRADDAIALAFRREWVRAGRPPLPAEAVAACVEHAREALLGGTIKRRAAERAERRRPVPPWAAEVTAAVEQARCLAAGAVAGNRVDRDASDARQEAYWLLRERGLSLGDVGRALGGRDRAVVLRGIRRVAARVAADPGYGQELLAIGAGAGDELAARRRVA